MPSAFQVPNEVVDEGWLAELGCAEVKVLLFIIRKTFGFNKIAGDRIPLSQIIEKLGCQYYNGYRPERMKRYAAHVCLDCNRQYPFLSAIRFVFVFLMTYTAAPDSLKYEPG